ncbi:uncharacterized protein [Drosophila pseudoobscura]|uniref:Uncharacterized protein n=1 Tax=Drosophila pseudoobscura pseudoobscura TaxID=46245 RepID=A0A6I8VFQ6_DROPS|nr:uncharacterized protein LOC26532631 [Drosophila pseudoobscura]
MSASVDSPFSNATTAYGPIERLIHYRWYTQLQRESIFKVRHLHRHAATPISSACRVGAVQRATSCAPPSGQVSSDYPKCLKNHSDPCIHSNLMSTRELAAVAAAESLCRAPT